MAVVLLAGVLPFLVSLAAYVLFGQARWELDSLHECLELVGSCIALGVAMLLWMRLRHEDASSHLLWVAAALVAMGIVDGLHGVHGISLRSWQRHGATLMGGVLFGLVWLPLPPAVTRRKGLFVVIVAGLSLALGLWWESEWMPVTWDPVGLYTVPVKAANVLGGLGFLAAAAFFLGRYLRQAETEDLVFASHTLLFGASGLFFGFSHTWAADWWVWHGARLLAYSVLLAASYDMVVTLYQRIARQAQELEGDVEARTAELLNANEALRASIVEGKRAKAEVERRGEEQARLNAELTRSHRATLNLMQDAVAAKTRLEERVAERTAQIEEANTHLRAGRALTEAIRRAQAQFIAADPSQNVFDGLLGSLLDLTGSAYGFIDEMFYTPDGKPYLCARAITDISWNEQTRGMYAQFISGELNFTKVESLFGAVMTTGKPVIANDAPHDPRRGGIPPGHPALDAFLGLPLHSNNTLVGVIGLANRPGGYSEDVITRLEPMVQACANLLSAWRSERKREEAETALARRTAQVEAANRELEAFSYSVSHDLRAPLRAIDGYGRILLEDHAERLDGEGRRVLGVMSSETQRMGQLIDDLLAFSRLGRQHLDSSDIDMTAMFQAAFGEQAAQSPKRVLQLELGPLLPAHGDRALIRVVLGNLLSNAIKFTRPRDPAVIEVGSRQEDGQCIYHVKDNGVGFDMRSADKLFGVFQRLHSTEEFEGTGVGLALVQRVVHRHGGRVWAEGRVNQGATFSFSLPGMKEDR